MPGIRIPKTIRWIFFCTLLLLVMQSVYRTGIYIFFKVPLAAGPLLQKSLWTGFRFDLFVTAIISLLIFLLGFAPGLHIFRRSTGRRLAILLYALFALLLMLVATADFAYILAFGERINGRIITDVATGTTKGTKFTAGIPWIPSMIAIGLATWFFYLIIKFLHQQIANSRSSDDKGMRRYWQVLTLLLLCFSIYFSPQKEKMADQDTAKEPFGTYAASLSLNPLQSFFESIFNKQRTAPIVKPS